MNQAFAHAPHAASFTHAVNVGATTEWSSVSMSPRQRSDGAIKPRRKLTL